MRLVFGLGNPGEKYKITRHNIGALLVDMLVESLGGKWSSEPKFKADTAKVGDTVFAKPQTYMNESGFSVAEMVAYFKVSPEEVVVVHDDLDLQPGDVRRCLGCGSAGHKGVESIFTHLGTPNFFRLRVGIGRPTEGISPDKYVLMDLSKEELTKLKSVDLSAAIGL